MVTELACASDIARARLFIEQNGLSFEEGYDNLAAIHDGGEIAAVGARQGNILKMLAVAPSHQGGALLGELTSFLIERGYNDGFDSLFVFTRPEYSTTFEALNFSLLASHDRVVLLEYGGGLKRWLSSHLPKIREGVNGALVMNCNPFTLGHRYLVETASRRVDNLYLFVVREDRSVFPFDIRYRLVAEGVRDIANVILLDTSFYAISSVTFPMYFLKGDDQAARIQMELDLTLFATRIAPFFKVSGRFVGTEPNCPATGSYNNTMKRLLPSYGIEVVEIERKRAEGGVISASTVRDRVKNRDFTSLESLVPETTLSFLRSGEAAPILERIRGNGRSR